jgi:hypothetical protein
MTQKQGENAEYMFESRTTRMQERENDEVITNMDTPTVVAHYQELEDRMLLWLDLWLV